MAKKVKDLMLALSEYAVVDESSTVMDAVKALTEAQKYVPPDRQPHRAVLIRGAGGEVVGKIHHFAFLRALIPDRKAMGARAILDRAGVGDDLRDASMQTLDLLTADLVDVTERFRNMTVREVYRAVTVSIDEGAPLLDATPKFLQHQTLSLLVTRRGVTVGILRLSDFFDEISRQALHGDSSGEGS
jgi:hypothetical protein